MKHLFKMLLLMACAQGFCVSTCDADVTALSNMPGPWQQVAGRARDIGVDGKGVAWIVSCDEKVAGGYAIYKADPTAVASWAKVDGGAVHIAVTPDGDVWTVDDAGNVRCRKARDTAWSDVAGKARDISVDAAGVVWKIADPPVGDDYSIYKYQGAAWEPVDGAAQHLAVGVGDAAWIVKSNGVIYWRHNGKWELQDGMHAGYIAADAKGPAWVLNAPADPDGNCRIYQDDGFHGMHNGWHWHEIPGSAVRIIMQQYGIPWVLRKDGSIFRSSLKPATHNLVCSGVRGMVKVTPDGNIIHYDLGGTDGIAFDSQGNLFVSHYTDILKVAPGETKGTVYQAGLDRAWALAVDARGNVFYSEFRNIKDEPKDKPDRKDGAIYMLTPEKVKYTIDAHRPYAYGLKTDAQGNLYLGGFGNICKYTMTGTTGVSSIIAYAGGWTRDLAFDAQGNIFVNGELIMDPKQPNAIKDSTGNWNPNWANVLIGIIEIPKDGGSPRLFSARDDLSHPVGLAFDEDGDLYSADYNDGKDYNGVIYRYTPDGSYSVYASGFPQAMWLAFEPEVAKAEVPAKP